MMEGSVSGENTVLSARATADATVEEPRRMTTLIVTAHPEPESLTSSVAASLASVLDSVEIADLAAEGFDPRFTVADRITYATGSDAPPDVVAEQRRVDRATDLVLVFPVYWWSLPAVTKGWIDRVFINGWAFDIDERGIERKMQGLTIHLVAIAGDDAGLYERHGYRRAFLTQLRHGVIDYVGARRGAVAFVHGSEGDAQSRVDAVDRAVEVVRAKVRAASTSAETVRSERGRR